MSAKACLNYIPIDNLDLVLASALVILNAILSFVLRLGLERQILIAMVRMLVQLSLVGLVLKALFALFLRYGPGWLRWP